jgi:hypothetical protein
LPPDGSDHLRCTITSISSTGPTALCSGQIAIGGSMLLANDETFTLSASPPPTPINGGTGIPGATHGIAIVGLGLGGDRGLDFPVRKV